jgi:Neuraminidase (sialidase)
MISRTTDAGAHWSAPQPMTNANEYAQGNQIVVLPDGSLLDVQAVLFKGSGIQPNLNGVYMAVMRSMDDGLHWSSPSTIAKLGTVAATADGQPLRVGDYLPDIVVDRASGNVYVTWADGMGTSTNKIVMSRSTDGGRHWSSPSIVSHNNSAQSFNHAISVAGDGELVALYYDTARNTSARTDGIPTDVYIRHSSNAGATWSTPQLLMSYDFTNAPIARGYFVGDYQGLEPIGAKDLIAFFGVAGKRRASAEVYSVRLSR